MKVIGVSNSLKFIKTTAKQLKNNTINLKNKNHTETLLPTVSVPILAFVLQNEDEAIKKIFEDIMNGKFVPQNVQNNITHIQELEKLKIIDQQQPWENPRYDDGKLTDTTYNEISSNIQKSSVLTDAEKQKHLQRLAENNYKTYNPSFKKAPNNETSGIENNNMDSSDHFADIDNSDIDNIPGLHEDLTELNSVGIDMSPELQEIYDAPPIESAQELIEQLLGDLADSVNIDWDFESIIDTMLDEITDIGDWL